MAVVKLVYIGTFLRLILCLHLPPSNRSKKQGELQKKRHADGYELTVTYRVKSGTCGISTQIVH